MTDDRANSPSVAPAPPPLRHAPSYSDANPETHARMTTLTIHLPTHQHLLPHPPSVSLPSHHSVGALKHIISSMILGEPRPEGIRVMSRGNVVADEEVVGNVWGGRGEIHLAVHPAAWRRSSGEGMAAASSSYTNALDQLAGTYAGPSSHAPTPVPAPTFPATPAFPSASPLPTAPPLAMALPPTSSYSFQPIIAPDTAVNPLGAAQAYYLYLYNCAIATLTASAPPASPYADAAAEVAARASTKRFIDATGMPSGLDGPVGCYFPGVGEGGPSTGGEWKTVTIDGLPYLLQTSAFPTRTPEQVAALQTLLAVQPILHVLSLPLPNAAAPPAPVRAGNGVGRPRIVHVQLSFAVPPFALIAQLVFLLVRVAFFSFLLTRGGGMERKIAVVLVATLWAMWEVQGMLRRLIEAAPGQAVPNADVRRNAANGNAPAPANAPAAAGQRPGARAPAAPSPIFIYLAGLTLPSDDLLLFPPPNPPPPPPTILQRILANRLASLPFLFIASFLPEFSRLRAKLLADRERRIRECYGPAKSLNDRRAREGEDVTASEEEAQAVRNLARLAPRERAYVGRVLRGEVDEVAVMWAAAEGADEVNGMLW